MAPNVIVFTRLLVSFFRPTPDPPLIRVQGQVSPFLQQVFMPLVLAIFEVLGRPAEENDQAAALEKQMLRRSYFSFIQTITGSGMNEVMANQGEWSPQHHTLKLEVYKPKLLQNESLLHMLVGTRDIFKLAQQFIRWLGLQSASTCGMFHMCYSFTRLME